MHYVKGFYSTYMKGYVCFIPYYSCVFRSASYAADNEESIGRKRAKTIIEAVFNEKESSGRNRSTTLTQGSSYQNTPVRDYMSLKSHSEGEDVDYRGVSLFVDSHTTTNNSNTSYPSSARVSREHSTDDVNKGPLPPSVRFASFSDDNPSS